MKTTIISKLAALVFIALGIAPTFVEGDLTVLIFMASIAIPLFFAKESWFVLDGEYDDD